MIRKNEVRHKQAQEQAHATAETKAVVKPSFRFSTAAQNSFFNVGALSALAQEQKKSEHQVNLLSDDSDDETPPTLVTDAKVTEKFFASLPHNARRLLSAHVEKIAVSPTDSASM